MKFDLFSRRPFAAILISATLLSGCATPPEDPELLAEYEAINDPLEPFNRAIFDFNMAADRYVLKPVAQGYRYIMPEEGREAVSNFLSNLRAPFTFVNDILQLSPDAGNTFGRFLVNSTLGVAGIFDVATDWFDMPPYDHEDFGQTLAVWGIPDGPYLMLPFFGPSNPRDFAGTVAAMYGEPTDLAIKAATDNYWTTVRMAGEIISDREKLLEPLEQLERNSLDFYATVRSISRQKRQDDVNDRRGGGDVAVPGIGAREEPDSTMLAAQPASELEAGQQAMSAPLSEPAAVAAQTASAVEVSAVSQTGLPETPAAPAPAVISSEAFSHGIAKPAEEPSAAAASLMVPPVLLEQTPEAPAVNADASVPSQLISAPALSTQVAARDSYPMQENNAAGMPVVVVPALPTAFTAGDSSGSSAMPSPPAANLAAPLPAVTASASMPNTIGGPIEFAGSATE